MELGSQLGVLEYTELPQTRTLKSGRVEVVLAQEFLDFVKVPKSTTFSPGD